MKKPIVFALIFASSLFLSACTGPKNSSPADSDKSDTPNPQSQETFSLRDLIAKNIPQKSDLFLLATSSGLKNDNGSTE